MNEEQISSLHRLEAGGSVRMTISQETFDETVKETMDDFDMEFAEALQEAIDQFLAQGVDLRNIKKDDPASRMNVSKGVKEACELLRNCVLSTEAAEPNEEGHRLVSDDDKAKTLSALTDLLAESEISDERRSAAFDEGAIGICAAVNTWMIRDKDVVMSALETMTSLFKLDSNKEAAAGCCGKNPVAGAMVAAIAHHIQDADVQEKGFLAIRQACVKFEYGKVTFDEANLVELLVESLRIHSESPTVAKCACVVMRQLVLRDDHREQTDQCFDRARELNEKRALQEACKVLRKFQTDLSIVPVVLSTLACAALNKDNVDALVRCDVRDIALDIFRENPDNAGLVKDACFLFGAISMLDEQKKLIGQGDGMALIIAAMDKHRSNAAVMAKALKAIAILTLRMPVNSTRLAETGSIPLICDIMRCHREKANIQASCLTLIRNLVSRNQELLPKMNDEGVEELVRRASGLPGCNELAYSALRDLRCDVKFKEEWKGDIGFEKRLAQGDGKIEDEDMQNLLDQTKEEMAEATGLGRFAT